MAITVRLRHPRGISTLELEPDSTTIEDLKSMIFSQTEIAPSEQELKYSYPPKPLAADDTALLSSIPITKGEQIIVTEASGAPSSRPAENPGPKPNPATSGFMGRPAGPPMLRQSAPVGRGPAPVATPAPAPTVPSAASSGGESSRPGGGAADKQSVVVDLPDGNGVMNHVIVPDDNSCLFSSIATIFLGGMDRHLVASLRQVVAEAIRANPDEYPDVVLGMPRDRYISTITKSDSWGGAIELSIFAKHFKTEIASFDVQTGRADRYEEGQYDSRCIVVYSGIHYDAIATAPMQDAPREFQTTVFPVSDETIMPAAQKLVQRLKDNHYYTDTAGFDLRCQVCREGLKGEKAAREHAKATGHTQFGEY